MEGFYDKGIASRLRVGLDTVRTYWERIRAKFGGITRSEVLTKMGRLDAEVELAVVQREVSELQRREGELREIADLLPELVWVTRPDGRLAFFNKHFLAYSGSTEIAAQMSGLVGFIHADDVQTLDALRESALRPNQQREGKVRFRQHDGIHRWHLVKKVPSVNNEGVLQYWLSTATDVHESHLLTVELELSRQRLEEAEFLGSLGVWDFYDGKIQFWSENLYRVLGLEPQKTPPAFEDFLKLVIPEDRHLLLGVHTILLTTSDQTDTTLRIKLASGEVRRIRARGSARTDPVHGRVLRGFIQDITEAYDLQTKYEQTALSRQAILDNAGVGIMVLSAQGMFVHLNRKLLEMTGYEESELVGKGGPELLNLPDHREEIARIIPGGSAMSPAERFEAVTRVLVEGKEQVQTTFVRKDGSHFPVRFTVSSFEESDHSPAGFIALVEDLTHSRQIEIQANEHDDLLSGIFGTFPGLIYIYDLIENRYTFVAGNLPQVLGYTEAEILEMGNGLFEKIVHPEDLPNVLETVQAARNDRTDESRESVYRLRHKSGAYNWVSCRDVIFQRLPDGQPWRNLGVCFDVTELKDYESRLNDEMMQRTELAVLLEYRQDELERANSQLARLAATDGLTGLLNHRAFHERLVEEISLAGKSGGGFSVLFMDVDQFKGYNDSFGHPAGDFVLRQVARLIECEVRGSDLVVRYGGEEFAVVLPIASLSGAASRAESIRMAIESHAWPHRQVTLSVGVAQWKPGEDKESVLTRADKALYEAKTGGRNRVCLAQD